MTQGTYLNHCDPQAGQHAYGCGPNCLFCGHPGNRPRKPIPVPAKLRDEAATERLAIRPGSRRQALLDPDVVLDEDVSGWEGGESPWG